MPVQLLMRRQAHAAISAGELFHDENSSHYSALETACGPRSTILKPWLAGDILAHRLPAVAEVDVALLVPEGQVEHEALVEAGVLQPRVHARIHLVKDAGNADEQGWTQCLDGHTTCCY